MAALPEGSRAPDFALSDADGTEFRLSRALRSGSVLLAFYKTDCPTCQYGLPFVDRLAASVVGRATAVAVCQDTPLDAARFSDEFGVGMPQVFDREESRFPVSNAYGLTRVPTVFLVEPDGRIAQAMVSWSKGELEEISAKLSVAPPFKPGEDVLPFRPG